MTGRRLPAALVALAVVLPGAPAVLAQLASDRPFIDHPMEHPNETDPEARDAVELFSRFCISTHADRARVVEIIGSGDSSVEKLDERTVLQLQNGKPGGIAWTLRMPLGEKLILEFAAAGTCIVRAPRVEGSALERGLDNLLEEIGSGGQFKVRRIADDTKAIEKRKYHFVSYSMRLPDSGQTAEIGVATTDAKDAFIQGSLTYAMIASQ